MRRQAAEARLAVDEASREPTRGRTGVDLVVAHVVALALELDAAEEELRRAFPRPRRVQPGEPAGEVDEGDAHGGEATVVAGGYLVPSQAPTHPGALSVRLDV